MWKLERVLGGKEEVLNLKKAVDDIWNLVKRIMLSTLENSLPSPMPYPVMNTILSYLLPIKGTVNIGPITTDNEAKELKRKDMLKLYFQIAEVFIHLKGIMFNTHTDIVPFTSTVRELSIIMKEILLQSFESLVATVASSYLQIHVEGLDVNGIEVPVKEEEDKVLHCPSGKVECFRDAK